MRAISAVVLCMGLIACDSSDGNSSGGKDGSTDDDSAVVVSDAGAGSLDAEGEDPDALVSEVDAADIDAAAGEDAEVPDAALDADVVDTSVVPDTSVPDTSVPLTADQMLEAQVTAKMRAAGVIAATGDFKGNKVVDSYDRCLSSCYLAATNENLAAAFCQGVANAVVDCIEACSKVPVTDGFHCASGDQIIPHYFVCDGQTADCSGNTCNYIGCLDESDEANCPTFTCDTTAKVLQAKVCDGEAQCHDKTDETGCASICYAE